MRIDDRAISSRNLVLRPQIMADSGMPLRMPFQNAQQHAISEHPNHHSFKNIWQKNCSAKPFFRAFQNVYAVRGSGMAILSVFQNAPKIMFQECCSKKGENRKFQNAKVLMLQEWFVLC